MDVIVLVMVIIFIAALVFEIFARKKLTNRILTYLPTGIIVLVTGWIFILYQKSVAWGKLGYAIFLSLCIFQLIAVLISTIIVDIYFTVFKKLPKRQKDVIKTNFPQDINEDWECPQCKEINKSASYICENCGYKVV